MYCEKHKKEAPYYVIFSLTQISR